jgi:hypothetical protein
LRGKREDFLRKADEGEGEVGKDLLLLVLVDAAHSVNVDDRFHSIELDNLLPTFAMKNRNLGRLGDRFFERSMIEPPEGDDLQLLSPCPCLLLLLVPNDARPS